MFPLSDKREDNFLAGLSMGGYGALRNAMVYSENFSHVAGLSSALHLFEKDIEREFEGDLFDDMEKAAKTNLNPFVAFDKMRDEKRLMPKFYLACGTADDLYDINVKFRDHIKSGGADVTWDEDGSGHEWDFWDSQIRKVLDWLPLNEE